MSPRRTIPRPELSRGAETRRALERIVEVDGVLAAGRWSRPEGDLLHLVHYVAAVGVVERDTQWWIMNFCEWNDLISQAQSLEYENRSGSRTFFPPRFTIVHGRELAFVGTRNRATALLDPAREPDLWRIVELLESVP